MITDISIITLYLTQFSFILLPNCGHPRDP